jgi:uncharacterized protein (DUF2141 family)
MPKYKHYICSVMRVYYSLFVLCLIVGCANIIPPSGGSKDVDPPKLLATNVSNGSINFSGNKFTFEFDERIKTKNLVSEFYLSPPSNNSIEHTLKGERLQITLAEELSENTTYTLSLGNSILDLNEGNPLAPFSIHFSTGAFLDSLSLKGTVKDALANEPKKDIWILLYIYSVENDSLLFKQKANYITKTNNDGSFHFQNLKQGIYVVYALEDLDNNLKFSLPSESVGFKLEPIHIPIDTTEELLIHTFLENYKEDSIVLLKRDSLQNYGFLKVDSIPEGEMLVELLSKGKVVFQKAKCNGSFSIDSLNVGTYKLRLINDINQNGKWDSGKIIDKIQPEDVYHYSKEIQIRANWDVLLNWRDAIE